MTHRDDVARLEVEFADAMQRMYVVGNGLARLRHELEQQPVVTTTPRTASAAVRSGGPAQGGVAGAAQGGLPHHAAGTGHQGVPVPAVAGAPGRTTSSAGSTSSGPVPRPSTQAPPAGPPVVGLPPVPGEPWYRREGAVTRVLAVSGAVVTLSGVAMLLVLAVRHGWFGPGARVTAGALLAGLLGGLGVRGGARDRDRGSPAGSAPVTLVATGAAVAYLDVVAVTALYGWLPASVGVVLCLAVSALGSLVARRWGSELLAVLLVGGGGLFAPVVAGRADWVLAAVLAVLAAVGWWAGQGRTTPWLTLVRVVPVTLALLAGAAATAGRPGAAPLVAVGLVVLATTVVTSALSVRRDADDIASSAALAVVATGALAAAAALSSTPRALVHGAVGAVLLLAATALGRAPLGRVAPHLLVTTATAGSVSAVLAVLSGAPDGFVRSGLLLLALAHLAVAGATRSRIALGLGAGVGALGVLAWLPDALAVTTVRLATDHDLASAFVASVLAAAVAVLAWWAACAVRGVAEPVRRLAAVLAWAVGLAATATALVSVGTLSGVRLGSAETGFTAGHALATVVWMAAAAGLLLHSLEHPSASDLALRSGLLLSAVAVAKLFLFDLAALDGVVRSVAFIATGLLLLATGSRYARAWERARPRTSAGDA